MCAAVCLCLTASSGGKMTSCVGSNGAKSSALNNGDASWKQLTVTNLSDAVSLLQHNTTYDHVQLSCAPVGHTAAVVPPPASAAAALLDMRQDEEDDVQIRSCDHCMCAAG